MQYENIKTAGKAAPGNQNPTATPESIPSPAVRYEKVKDTRNWAVYDEENELVCLCVYKRGAEEVVRRLST